MLREITRYLFRRRWNDATPGNEMLQVRAIGAQGIVREFRVNVLAHRRIALIAGQILRHRIRRRFICLLLDYFRSDL